MSDHTALTKPTREELQNAQTKGQVIGWVQGGGAVFLLGFALKFLGWIPVIAVAGVVGLVAYKLMAGSKK